MQTRRTAEGPLARVLRPGARLCIVRLSALGDVLHVLPALEALARIAPDAEFSWITEALAAPLIEDHPRLERIWILPRKDWQRRLGNPLRIPGLAREILGYFRRLRREDFALTLDFQGNLRGALAARFSGATVTLGFNVQNCREGSHVFHTLKAEPVPPRSHRVERNMALPRFLGYDGPTPLPRLPAYTEERARARAWIGSPRPVAVFHPGVSAFGAFKAWTEEGFAELADTVTRTTGLVPVFSWGPDDRDLVDRILARMSTRARKAPPSRTIRDVAGLVAEAAVLVAPDTGVLHLADALGTPVVGLFGPKDPAVYGPRFAPRRIVRADVDCSPCARRTCKHRTCMRSITPAMVLDAITGLLDKEAP